MRAAAARPALPDLNPNQARRQVAKAAMAPGAAAKCRHGMTGADDKGQRRTLTPCAAAQNRSSPTAQELLPAGIGGEFPGLI